MSTPTTPIESLTTLERVRRDISHIRRRTNDGYVDRKLTAVEHDVRGVLCYLNEFLLANATERHPSLEFYTADH